MGRTKRKRKAKCRNFETCNNIPEVILLNTWLTNQKCIRNSKLVMANFPITGRGVLTKKAISTGEELISLPLNLTINVTTILMDNLFMNMFLNTNRNIISEFNKSLSFQSLLAFYLIHLKSQNDASKWQIYLQTLPVEYTVPYFLSDEIKPNLFKDILTVIMKQKDIIESSYNIFNEILSSSVNSKDIFNIKKYFTKSEYEWAYFTVNTRCVYMDLSKLLNYDNTNTIFKLLNDNTNIALCPYLDMINHSPNVKNETKLILNTDIVNIDLQTLNEGIFENIYFNLYTKNNIEAYKEVFICYGDSHNLKLITEYGFFLPSNDLDCVTFTFVSIDKYLASKDIKLSQDQHSFISNHGLNKDLYIDSKGLSFNFYALLMVVKYYYKQNRDVSKIIYSAAQTDSRNLNDLIAPLVKEYVDVINKQISELELCCHVNVVLGNCIALMCQYVNILEKFIKC